MTWEEIDSRLAAVGKDRRWLADVTPYTYDSIRNTMAPAQAGRRSDRMLSVLSRAIEDEEGRQWHPREVTPGVFEIFQTSEQIDRADRASRIAGAPSLTQFCRDVILDEADRLLAQESLEKRHPRGSTPQTSKNPTTKANDPQRQGTPPPDTESHPPDLG